MDTISIIIPIYNISEYLDKCIESVIRQTYQDLQIILVDDGSTDGSSAICDRYAQEDKRIEVIHKENGGLVSARKAGLNVAEGKYTAYVDADDYIESCWIETLVTEATDAHADIVDGGYYLDYEGLLVESSSRCKAGRYAAKELLGRMLCDEEGNECNFRSYVWCKLWKTDVLRAVQMQVDNRIVLGEDVAVTYPGLLQCKRVSIIDYAGYHYVQRRDSMSHRKTDEEYKNLQLLEYNVAAAFAGYSDEKQLLRQLEGYIRSAMLGRCIDITDFGLPEDTILKAWGGISRGSRVTIYGAGRIGQSVYSYLTERKLATVVGWLDREYKLYDAMGLPVLPPDRISEIECDYIIIAIFSHSTSETIREWIIGNCTSIDNRQIVTILPTQADF